MSATAIRAWYCATGVNWATPVTSPACPDPGDGGAKVPVDGDSGPRRLDADRLEVQALDVGRAPRRNQKRLRPHLEGLRAVLRRDGCRHLTAVAADGLDEDREREVDPLVVERRGQGGRGFGVGERRDPVGRVDDRHARAEARERLAELEPDRACADDEQ
jgi:hypothetical protein